MVALDQVKLTNSRVVTELAPDLVAVFAGGTAGIGELAMRAFARDAVRPRIYFIGRSEAQGERLAREMQEENAAGQYVFLKADFSLMSNVDKVAREIREREKTVNLLVMTQGTLNMGPGTLRLRG
jgi:short-subunit dehydrogenase